MKKMLVFLVVFALASVSALALPSVGDMGVDTTHMNSWSGSSHYGTYVNDWTVCRADEDSAWISAYDTGLNIVAGQPVTSTTKAGGNYDAEAVCRSLGYSSVGAYGGTCGTVCGFCENHYGGTEHYEYSGGSPSDLSYTVHWECLDYVGNDNEVPEFGLIGAGIALLGASLFVFRKRK